MATTTVKRKKEKAKSLNSALVNATVATINTTIENGEKWQKLTKKLVKKSEPIRRKQMDMFFDTANTVKKQVKSGKERTLDLVGYDEGTAERAYEYVSKTPVGKTVLKVTENLKEKVTENPTIKKVEKTAKDIKTKGTAKFNDVKEDVLGQVKKVIHKGEEFVDEALKPSKDKATKTKKTVKAKAQTETVKKEEAVAKMEVEVSGKNDLKLIKGIGPKLERIFNENGIETFMELAEASDEKIQGILDKAGPIFKNLNFSDWKKEAKARG